MNDKMPTIGNAVKEFVHGLADEIKVKNERIEALQARVDVLEAALRDAPAALNAMAAQVEAEWRDHDKAAARHDLVVQTFIKKVRDALESQP